MTVLENLNIVVTAMKKKNTADSIFSSNSVFFHNPEFFIKSEICKPQSSEIIPNRIELWKIIEPQRSVYHDFTDMKWMLYKPGLYCINC